MRLLTALLFTALSVSVLGCEEASQTSDPNEVQRVETEVEVDPTTGRTVEQQNIEDRLLLDNDPGAIKHLYVISAYSGQVLLYSTVRGKVTSSGKRLTPYESSGCSGDYCSRGEVDAVRIRGAEFYTTEIMQDDGTYGSSISYLFWWDAQGRYHQHYVSGGQILHISDQPIRVPDVVIRLSDDN